MVVVSVEISPATASRWTDIGEAFGRQASNAGSCWCQRFRHHDAPDNRAALRQEVETADVPVGLLVYVDADPAGWTRVVPRHTLPGVAGNRALRKLLEDDPTAWWVACVVVRRQYRGSGVGTELLRAATVWAREHGASLLDGHPVDVDRLRSTPSASAVFTGTVAMFEAAGFTEIGRTYPSRPVMRQHLAGAED